jgi:hypothetical protein
MVSSYSTDLKLELMVTGENAGTWGEKTNDNLNCIQQAIAGVQSIDVGAADVTLVMSNSPTLSNARNMVLVLTGSLTGTRQVLVPDGIEKFYIIKDSTTRNGNSLTFKTVSGSGFAIETSGIMVAAFSDGTNVQEISLNTLSGTIAGAQIDNLAISSAKLASFAVTTARVASFAVTSSRLATNAVTAIKITQSTITQSKLAADSVGSNQLIATGVTPASYTAATITVDADGRITAASSGSGGAGMGILTLGASGPTSGTYTANPSANRLAVYMWAGGGGGGRGPSGGTGGNGGYGFYNKPITQPFAQPYAVGAPGAGGAMTSGSAGGATNFTNVGTVNAGNGGNRPTPAEMTGNPGSAGNAPGASYVPPIRNIIVDGYGVGGGGGGQPYLPGNPGAAGALIIFENTGT